MRRNACTDIYLTEGGFVHRGRPYAFSQVAHVFFSRALTTQRLNFMKMGEAESACLKLSLDTGESIEVVVDEETIWFGLNKDKSDQLMHLFEMHTVIVRETFNTRIAPYIAQLRQNGYFLYDKCLFFPKARVVRIKGKAYSTRDYSFRKGYGFVAVYNKNPSIGDKFKEKWDPPQFNTQTDTDILFTLLKSYFRLSWA